MGQQGTQAQWTVPCSDILSPDQGWVGESGAGEAGSSHAAGRECFLCYVLLLPAFLSCLSALLGTMRRALLLAVILVLSLALGAVCEESQEQVVPRGGRREVRHPSSGARIGRVLGNIMGEQLCWFQKLQGKVWPVGWELPGLSVRGLISWPLWSAHILTVFGYVCKLSLSPCTSLTPCM